MKHKLNKSPEEVMSRLKIAYLMQENLLMMLNGLVKTEHEHDMDYMWQDSRTCNQSGAKTINIPDTVGYTVPSNLKLLKHY